MKIIRRKSVNNNNNNNNIHFTLIQLQFNNYHNKYAKVYNKRDTKQNNKQYHHHHVCIVQRNVAHHNIICVSGADSCGGIIFIIQLSIIIMIIMMTLMTQSCLANKQNDIISNILLQSETLSTQMSPINTLLYLDNMQKDTLQQQQQQQQQSYIKNNINLGKPSSPTSSSSSFSIETTLTDSDKHVVEDIIRQWSPIVWLAPQEKFMPLGVEEFLTHVHPETKSKYFTADMPMDEIPEKAYLVTNADIEDLLDDDSSFIHGRNPNLSNVPIYAIVTLCPRIDNQFMAASSTTLNPTSNSLNVMKSNKATASSYMPIPINGGQKFKNVTTIKRSSRLYPIIKRRRKRQIPIENDLISSYNLVSGETVSIINNANTISTSANKSNMEMEQMESENTKNTVTVNNFIANLADNVKFSLPMNANETNILDFGHKVNDINQQVHNVIPTFHVTYWMFYPYSQGKNMCTLNLGPFGSIPFPTVYGYCLGSNKDIGSHIGDWEHMSLYFNGAAQPESMYVSAHDAGAYYLYNHLTGSFEFKEQETRKGILQRPNFPKTVTTFNDHPVLFAAKGSHGLWTAPGKHRFVKVARLYDINGFGTPWNTWKHVEISYNNLQNHERSLKPNWLHFKGKWGNPKSKCHPFRFIGLNFCEYTDGPTGIPLKKPHFQCGQFYKI